MRGRRVDGMTDEKTSAQLRLDERNHVEKPFLDQLHGFGWEIIDLDGKQHPSDSFRQSFAEVVMLPVLREQIKVINDWMEDDQIEEVVKQLTAGFPGTGLIQNNRHVFTLLLEKACPYHQPDYGDRPEQERYHPLRRIEPHGAFLQNREVGQAPQTDNHRGTGPNGRSACAGGNDGREDRTDRRIETSMDLREDRTSPEIPRPAAWSRKGVSQR